MKSVIGRAVVVLVMGGVAIAAPVPKEIEDAYKDMREFIVKHLEAE